MSDNEDGEQPPKRRKRPPMFYKQYLQGDGSVSVPRTTLIQPPRARDEPTPTSVNEEQGTSECQSGGSSAMMKHHIVPDPQRQDNAQMPNPASMEKKMMIYHHQDSSSTNSDSLSSSTSESSTNSNLDTETGANNQIRSSDPASFGAGGGGDGPSDSNGSSDHGESSDNDELSDPDVPVENINSSLSSEISERESEDGGTSTVSFDFDSQFVHRAKDLNNNYSLDDKIFKGESGPQKTRFECLLLVLCFATWLNGRGYRKPSKTHCLLGELAETTAIPDSLHIFHKTFSFDCGLEYYFYCCECEAFIGKKSDFDRNQKVVQCPIELCGESCNISSFEKQNFFIMLPLKHQLKCFLEYQTDIMKLLSYRFNREQSADTVRDIFDGLLYKRLAEEGAILSDVNNFSLTVNTNGSPIFLSNSNSMWPIQCRINELPPDKRFSSENMFLSGIWFGSHHPKMNLYMSKFALESRQLEIEGIEWRKPSGEHVKSKVVTINSCLDSVAKPTVQGLMQFNAYESCGYCYHPGDLVDLTNNVLIHPEISPEQNDQSLSENIDESETVDNPNAADLLAADASNSDVEQEEADSPHRVKIVKQVRFTNKGGVYPERTDAEMRADMVESVTTNKVTRGVKSMCPLIVLLSFNLVYGFVIDYMHCVLLGVTKQMLSLWLDTKFKDADFYIRAKIKDIDKRLLNLRPPIKISRRPQSIKNYTRWKAIELRSWLLYYCLPCFKEILPNLYFRHLSLLVTSIYILFSDNISFAEFDIMQGFLEQFVNDFETYYGPAQMVYNIHLLTHLTQCVRYWGPLWEYSAFTFETGNGKLKKLVKGTRGVVSQIARKYCMYRFLPKVVACYKVCDYVADYCKDLLNVRIRCKNVERVNEITLYESTYAPLLGEVRELLVSSPIPSDAPCFHRFNFKGTVFYSKTYSRPKEKSNDFTIRLKDGSYGVIERCVVYENNVYLVVRNINIAFNSFVVNHGTCKASHIKVCDIYPFGNLKVVNAKELSVKCLFLETRNESYVTVSPNNCEKD